MIAMHFSKITGTLVLFLVLGNVSSENGDLDSRILYGKSARIQDFPFFAHLKTCGATIISERWVLTAAHCLFYPYKTPSPLWVGGESLEISQKIQYDKVVVHPNYRPFSMTELSDIALLRLTKPLKFNHKIKPAKLPEGYSKNTWHTFVGKGRDETGVMSNSIMKLKVKKMSVGDCLGYIPLDQQFMYLSNLPYMEDVFTCVKGTKNVSGVCFGDSGSPMVLNDTVVGVASYIIDNDCHMSPVSFFVNVATFVPWIKQVTGMQ